MAETTSGTVIFGNNLDVLATMDDGSADLIYIDPPFNTGRQQSRTQISVERSQTGDRVGFKGQRYESHVIGTKAFADQFDDFLAFIEPRLVEAYRILDDNGTLPRRSGAADRPAICDHGAGRYIKRLD